MLLERHFGCYPRQHWPLRNMKWAEDLIALCCWGKNNDQNDDRYFEWFETGQNFTDFQRTPPLPPLLQRMFRAPYSRIPGAGGINMRKSRHLPGWLFVFVACFEECNICRCI